VGIYLVFASLIIPALAARRFPERMRLAVGYAAGIAGYLLGLIASALYDWPTGAVIVVALLVVLVAAVALSRAVPRQAGAAAT
jgi:zinc/manganese transport system permease protein